MKKILVIEDEKDISDLVTFNLQRHDYEVIQAYDGLSGLALAKKELPDLIILDLMLPELNGIGVLKKLRKSKAARAIPVMMLSARSQLEDRIAGLELGAEDYMTKPFSPKELVLRVNNIIKRTQLLKQGGPDLECGPFRFSKGEIAFFIDGEEVPLTVTEFKLMRHLCEHPGVPQNRETLLTHVFGYQSDIQSRTLDTHLKRLRKKLGIHADKLQTVRGVGYLIVEAT